MGYSGSREGKLKQVSALRGALKLFRAEAVGISGHELAIIFRGCGSRSNQGVSEAHNGLLWCALRLECYTTRLQALHLLGPGKILMHTPASMCHARWSLWRGTSSRCLGPGINKMVLAIVLEVG